MKNTPKYVRSVEIVEATPELRRVIPQYRKMLASTLYVALRFNGYAWDARSLQWVLRGGCKLEEVSEKITEVSESGTLFVIKLMGEKSVVEGVSGDMLEVLDLLDVRVRSMSSLSKNEDGRWWRISINCKKEGRDG